MKIWVRARVFLLPRKALYVCAVPCPSCRVGLICAVPETSTQWLAHRLGNCGLFFGLLGKSGGVLAQHLRRFVERCWWSAVSAAPGQCCRDFVPFSSILGKSGLHLRSSWLNLRGSVQSWMVGGPVFIALPYICAAPSICVALEYFSQKIARKPCLSS